MQFHVKQPLQRLLAFSRRTRNSELPITPQFFSFSSFELTDMRAFDAMEMAKKSKQLEKQRRKMTDEERVRTERLEAAEKRSRDADAARVALLKDAIKAKMRSERDMIRNEQEFNRKR